MFCEIFIWLHPCFSPTIRKITESRGKTATKAGLDLSFLSATDFDLEAANVNCFDEHVCSPRKRVNLVRLLDGHLGIFVCLVSR